VCVCVCVCVCVSSLGSLHFHLFSPSWGSCSLAPEISKTHGVFTTLQTLLEAPYLHQSSQLPQRNSKTISPIFQMENGDTQQLNNLPTVTYLVMWELGFISKVHHLNHHLIQQPLSRSLLYPRHWEVASNSPGSTAGCFPVCAPDALYVAQILLQ
jgi:hypothetical protein